jgi:Phage Terminase
LLGKPFMPWQKLVADVVMEIDSATGRLAYDELGLGVPRQSGKSIFILAKATHRCTAAAFYGSRQHLVYTAQTRQKAREKWEEDYAAELQASRKFQSRILVHKGNGNEHIRFKNGSKFGIEANTEKAGHGGTLDESYIDEAFAQVDWRLEQAFGPAMITRANKLLAWVSTAGWLGASPYLEEKVRIGRRAVAEDRRTGLCYFEWSAPEDCDPGDESVWWQCMPALGHTISIEAVRAEYDKHLRADKLHEFMRAYLNIWVPKMVYEPDLIDMTAWAGMGDAESQPSRGPVYGVAVSPDRTMSAVSVAGAREDGRKHMDVGRHDKGTAWVLGFCEDLDSRRGDVKFIIDGVGPAKSLIGDFRNAGLDVEVIGTSELGAAYGLLMDLIEADQLRHRNQASLNAAVKSAKKRNLGDGASALGRKASGQDITPLEAGQLALLGHQLFGGESVILW